MELKINLFNREFIARILAARTKKFYEVGYLKCIFEIRRKNKKYVQGYTNRCQDGKYVIFLDYDRIDPEWLVEEIKALQDEFELSDFYVFESSKNSYHAVCIDKMPLNEFVHIARNTSIDRDFIDVPMMYGKRVWTLRVTNKNDVPVRFMGKIPSAYITRYQSSAHAQKLNDFFDLDIDVAMPDNLDKLVYCSYPV